MPARFARAANVAALELELPFRYFTLSRLQSPERLPDAWLPLGGSPRDE